MDKFGARPSGTQTLENSIDYMIDLSHKEGLNDVVTEEVEVSHRRLFFDVMKVKDFCKLFRKKKSSEWLG